METELTNTRLSNRVALVTGGSGGIGSAIVERFLAEGAMVISTVSSPQRAAALKEKFPNESNLTTIQTDVSSEQSCRNLAAQIGDLTGRVDILVNNAGIFPVHPFEQMTFSDWRNVIGVNLDAVYLVTSNVLPLMKGRNWGRIINISSATIWLGSPGLAHYAAAKAGVIGLTRCLASELGKYGITANAVTPGLTSTEKAKETFSAELLERRSDQRPSKRQLLAKDIVGTVLFLASEDSELVTGQVINVDGGVVMR
jgi:NAD(P)-dependent dehydrogenase (short-subunit alcohol dehydrogenase family)